MEKTTKYLRCHTSGRFVTAGLSYEVISADAHEFLILDDEGSRHSFTREKYRNWFTLETDADSAAITLLPDESLGGVLREYREVKRKANVGELVKVTDDTCYQYTAGKVYIAQEETLGYGDIRIDSYNGGTVHLNAGEYVVLEASDILRIEDERFRMVECKAAVGDSVLFTKGNGCFRAGQVLVLHADADVMDCGQINFADGMNGTYDAEYRVLEPLTSAELAPTPTPLSELPLTDQYAENITVLTRKIAQLEDELRVAREDIVLIEEGVRDDIKALEERTLTFEKRILALETDSAPACVSVASGPVDNALPTFAKSAQQVRDEIVECAKADVSDLLSQRAYPVVTVEGLNRSMNSYAHYVDYVVNKEKRTVVAIVKHKDGGRVRVVGKSKCAPGETFNVHIGRAIALYRALGCEVPAEYLTCPQPETVRVGDVVLWTNSYDAEDTQVFTIASVLSEGYRFVGGEWDGFETVRVIDDSREDGGISASPSALKGAA
ncbi:hypothetical protein [Paenibacillus odorifer]|uniref:hypothetical protein n=1 Tax=Paenibacillus TaxID=44249 RepID=UPI00096E402F|nr:hypothetical protein [Paenibacillus odorifer]OMD02522.1 hypothetical protein BJP46_15580 [Paenibacillus odorifer]